MLSLVNGRSQLDVPDVSAGVDAREIARDESYASALDQFSGLSMTGGITSTACFEQEPATPLGLVEPDFD